MFKKQANLEDEIYRSMEQQLVSNQSEESYGFNKLAKAVDYIHAAAEIFEQAGMQKEAKEVTEVLRELTEQLSRKTSSI
jgi:hypothetical protein